MKKFQQLAPSIGRSFCRRSCAEGEQSELVWNLSLDEFCQENE